MAEPRVAVYPGTFDPVTNGHMDIITRAATHLVDKLILAVARNPGKVPLFTLEERVAMVQVEVDATEFADRVDVEPFDTLLTDFAQSHGANVLIRGLRAVSDFEYEFQMTLMNRQLNNTIETVFLMPSEQYSFLSSSLVKEVASFGGDVSHLVPKSVAEALARRLSNSD